MEKYLQTVKTESSQKYETLRERLQTVCSGHQEYNNICIFACGSMGRFDMTTNSDLDLFFIDSSDSKSEISRLITYVFFAELYKINHELGYEDPSKGGFFWRFTKKDDLLDIGSQSEDYNNSFTARMLLLLESKPLFNEDLYHNLISETVSKYFCDYRKNFYPLFLMNDILRYWYTLTLNYEFRRDINDDEHKKNWRRLKLKYARLITCFSLYWCLFDPDINEKKVIEYVNMSPIDRLEHLSVSIPESKDIIQEIFKEYSWYLELRKEKPDWWSKNGNKADAFDNHADKFHRLVTHDLAKLVIPTNKKLAEKTELSSCYIIK